ncbi:MAG: 2-amino-4-hydroxy-6-hydroxymethyldihydropteridine diphosphokinase [Pseudomonadota bacterium]
MAQASNLLPRRQFYLVALGANLESHVGPPRRTLDHAINYTSEYSCKVLKIGRFFSCPAFPAGNGPDYLNTAIEIEGPENPGEMIKILHRIENAFGREREVRWGQRTLDLDLIAAGDAVIPDEGTHAEWRALPLDEQMRRAPDQLILPHPRMHERAFVLVPLADIAPDWVHPILGKTVIEMRDALPKEALAELQPLE